jgi:uncharacterized protein with PhoU and TrkA domain
MSLSAELRERAARVETSNAAAAADTAAALTGLANVVEQIEVLAAANGDAAAMLSLKGELHAFLTNAHQQYAESMQRIEAMLRRSEDRINVTLDEKIVALVAIELDRRRIVGGNG